MIITRTPFRLSFFGGGSDIAEYYERFDGAVLGCAINKYCFITYRRLPPFFGHTNRIVYSAVEHTNSAAEIKHPAVRETLLSLGENGVEVHHDGDLPGGSGIGSSSSFVVGLLKAAYAARGRAIDARKAALDAYHIERCLAGETVGHQDQILAAYGGFRSIRFRGFDWSIEPHRISRETTDELMRHVLLVFTGKTRGSSAMADTYLAKLNDTLGETKRIVEMAGEAREILEGAADMDRIGRMLHESWELKKRRGAGVSDDRIDSIYSRARTCGALGGKVIGAGGGGFMMLFARPSEHARLRVEFRDLTIVGCACEPDGSRVIYNDENGVRD